MNLKPDFDVDYAIRSRLGIHRCCLAAVAIFCASVPSASVVGKETIDFNRDIRPVLSDKCFHCHGPDPENREADLRFDIRESAVEDVGAISPGSVGESSLIDRVTSDDADVVMPPPSTGKPVSPAEVELLKQWIQSGATYATHWAFVPPKRPSAPAVAGDTWNQSPIDPFVLSRMRVQGLEPSPIADRTTLVRRLYLDIVGLIPSPDEVDAFVQDSSPDAYRRLVDRLLDSPHYGERWARWWLDAARYADSDGYEKDKPRDVWFYRDWVIQAMNDDKPYNDFIIEQIAGDLLPNAGQSEHVATGFLRNSMVNEEGGADPEQFRVEGMFDRIDAIGKAILGITTQCAQCHSHKYDPLTQEEYYGMFAALNDIHEATMTVYSSEDARRCDAIRQTIQQIEEKVKTDHPNWPTRLAEWERSIQQARVNWTVVTPTDLPFDGQKFRVLDDGSIIGESYAPTRTSPTFRVNVDLPRITGFRLELLTHPQLPRGGPGRSIYGTGALTEFAVEVRPASTDGKSQAVEWASARADVNPAQSELPAAFRDRDAAKDKRITGAIEFAIDGNPQTAWTTDIDPGRRNQDLCAVFLPKQELELNGESVLTFQLQQNHGGWNSDDNQNYLLGRYRFSVTTDNLAETAHLPLRVTRILKTPMDQRTATQRAELFSFWRTTVAEFADANEQIEQLWKSFPAGESQLVVLSRGESRTSHVLERGDFLKPAALVSAGSPRFLGEMVDTQAADRLDFARFLASPDAPTTARAIVNRVWQAYFGTGLVLSPEDLGSQSIPPTHPELLDWLAVEFMDHGWSLKHLHRVIVSSATYQQASKISEALLVQDPYNRLLARGPRFRVDAETVRDIALGASGLLDREVGGPSIHPPAPRFLFEPPASYGPKRWPLSAGTKQYRRSLYVHTYRSVPYPVVQVFDAPKADAACVRRTRSNTPLQALVVLNETQFVDSARALAARVLRETKGDDRAKLDYAHRVCVARPPQDEEAAILLDLLGKQRARLARGELDASTIIGMDDVLCRQVTGQEVNEFAAWMVVARALLNLDETITKQ